MGTHTLLQSVIIQEEGSGTFLGQSLEGSGVAGEEFSMKSKKQRKLMKNTAHCKLHQKESQNKFVLKVFVQVSETFSFCTCPMAQETDL